jgi:acetyl esterase/lipase
MNLAKDVRRVRLRRTAPLRNRRRLEAPSQARLPGAACCAPTKTLRAAKRLRCYYARRGWRRRVRADGGDAWSVHMNASSGSAGASSGAQERVGAGAGGSGRKRGRRLVTMLAWVFTLLVAAIVVGALFPPFKLIAVIGTIFASFFTVHVFLAGLVGIALAAWARRLGGRTATTIVLWLAILATIGAAVPIAALHHMARHRHAPISLMEHLRVIPAGPRPKPDQTQLFATVDGKNLYLDIYLPASSPTGITGAVPPAMAMSMTMSMTPRPVLSAPVVMIHGGGYSAGQRSDGIRWDRWLAARGYTVFDVDYRLDPPVSWNLAAPDVACAMGWVSAHASDYHIAPDRMLITGQSAGGGLAMQVAYGLGDGTVTSSCGGTPPQPKAVFAIYPPEDFALAWNLDMGIAPASARVLNTGYIGGSPEQFPDRYRVVSPVFYVRPGLPPTLIAAGAHDHLVPVQGHAEMVEKLNAAGVPNEWLSIPYGEHGYDLVWGSIGGQITRKVVADFLDRYLPARE